MLQVTVRAPVSHKVAIDDLRPTQITLGMREVLTKRDRFKTRAKSNNDEFSRKHVIPVVKGPKDRFYIIDHHHLCRALQEAGVEDVSVTVVLNLARLDKPAFFFFLDNTGLLHPFDAEGRRRHYEDLPKSVSDMVDDPYRSLAGELRREGGYAKDTTPFSEFLWADFLRRQISRGDLEKDFDDALRKALLAAKSKDADYLPGWCGPIADDLA
jgi:hypothetical protein